MALAEIVREAGVAPTVTGDRPPDFAAMARAGRLAFRPRGDGQHDERHREQQHADAERELGRHETTLSPIGLGRQAAAHGSRSLTAVPVRTNDQSGTMPGSHPCSTTVACARIVPDVLDTVDAHSRTHRAADEIVERVVRSSLALARRRVDRRAGARTFVDRGADRTPRVEVDDEVRQHHEDEQRHRGGGDELHRVMPASLRGHICN